MIWFGFRQILWPLVSFLFLQWTVCSPDVLSLCSSSLHGVKQLYQRQCSSSEHALLSGVRSSPCPLQRFGLQGHVRLLSVCLGSAAFFLCSLRTSSKAAVHPSVEMHLPQPLLFLLLSSPVEVEKLDSLPVNFKEAARVPALLCFLCPAQFSFLCLGSCASNEKQLQLVTP